ncbi:MAG: FAD:protein FMN transferase [Chloroflexota bacterium]
MERMTRRDFLKIVGLTAGGAAAWKLGIEPRLADLVEVAVSRTLMGTVVNLTVIGEDRAAAEAAVAETLDHMGALEAVLSRHQAQSDLSRLNREGLLDNAGRPLLEVLQQARQVSEQSGGAFDVTVKPLLDLYQAGQEKGALPSRRQISLALPLVNYRQIQVDGSRLSFAHEGMGVTLDGIGKGYIVDQGTAVLRRLGFPNVLVEAGGDLMAAGVKEPGSAWTLGVQPPRAGGNSVAARFRLTDRAVATSGDYMQPFTPDFSQHHILDPRRGLSPPALSSVSVVADTACAADAWSTALMVLGPDEGLQLVERLPGVEALVVTKNGETRRSSAFPAEA